MVALEIEKGMYLRNSTKDLEENVKESEELKMAQVSGSVKCRMLILSTIPSLKSQG